MDVGAEKQELKGGTIPCDRTRVSVPPRAGEQARGIRAEVSTVPQTDQCSDSQESYWAVHKDLAVITGIKATNADEIPQVKFFE